MTLLSKTNRRPYKPSERVHHQIWCLKNEIRVYVVPINRIYCNVVTEIKGIEYYDNPTEYKLDNKPIRRRRKKGEPPHQCYSDVIMETYTNLYNKYYVQKEDDS